MHSARPLLIGLFVIVAASVFLILLPRADMIDATVRLEDLERVIHGQKTESKFSMVGPLFATPFYYLGQHLGDTKKWVWCFNRSLILIGCAVFWWLLRPALSAAERMRFIIALMLTSMVPHHLMHFGGEVFSSLVTAIGFAAVVVRRAWWGVPLAVLGAVNVPGSIGGLAVGSLVLIARTGRLRYLLAVPIAAGLVLLENYIRRGDPFSTGYDGEHGSPNALPFSGQKEFSYPFVFGVMSLLLSFGKGLIFFVPALFLPFPDDPIHSREAEADARWVYRIWIGVVLGLLLVYARWWAWYGGWFWGPRFFLFACFPAALVLARRTTSPERFTTAANLLTLIALALASWVGINGVIYQQLELHTYGESNFALEFVIWYVPECSALWWPYARPKHFKAEDWWYLCAGLLGFVYLAAPVVVTLLRRLPGHVASGWALLRGGARLRI